MQTDAFGLLIHHKNLLHSGPFTERSKRRSVLPLLTFKSRTGEKNGCSQLVLLGCRPGGIVRTRESRLGFKVFVPASAMLCPAPLREDEARNRVRVSISQDTLRAQRSGSKRRRERRSFVISEQVRRGRFSSDCIQRLCVFEVLILKMD